VNWIVSLTPDAAPEPLVALAAPPPEAAMVELRADLFRSLNPSLAMDCCPVPLLYTVRSLAEGGEGPVDPHSRRQLITAAYEAGVPLIDLELERDLHLIGELGLPPERVVVSWHDPDGTPQSLGTVAERLLATRAGWLKLVPTITSLDDLQRTLEIQRNHSQRRRERRRLLAFGMGSLGVASRLLAPLLGPPMMFAAWSPEGSAAPGQLTAQAMESLIGHLEGAPQRVFGVVGSDVTRSLSPVMHAAAYRALGTHDLFVPVSVNDATELDRLFVPAGHTLFDRVGLRAGGWAVTTPYKEEAAHAATTSAPRARRADAANTLVLRPGSVLADTTDADGITGACAHLRINVSGTVAVVQGAGGAARGAAVGLDVQGAAVALRGRSPARTRVAATMLGVGALGPEERSPERAILVNATPCGGAPDDPSPFGVDEIRSARAVVDMVYAPEPTALVRIAAEYGIPVADGVDVLLHQGIPQLAAMLGTLPPREAMAQALGRSLDALEL
jgi:3-dehydroquinate dehydratase type I